MAAWTEQARRAFEARWNIGPRKAKQKPAEDPVHKRMSWTAIEKEIDGKPMWLKRVEDQHFIWTSDKKKSMEFGGELEARRFIRENRIDRTDMEGTLMRRSLRAGEGRVRVVRIRIPGEKKDEGKKEDVHPADGE